ncbi:MAG: DUF1800 domain-containing protein [Chloroflexi bacterium]|nr:DUF1800 domain-containing protein [Chloroflexota bacterium]
MPEPMQRALAAMPPGALSPALTSQRDPVAHVIGRLTYGVTPELYTHVQAIGTEAFIEEQLAPESIADAALAERLAPLTPILESDAGSLIREYGARRGTVINALIGGAATRALYSQRQLYERAVEFWSDHFSVFIGKGPVLFLKVDEDREAIRPNSLGRFRDLLGASAHSPAMLFYLDNVQSDRSAPNENYARELLELHTLGVNGGYTEDDVKAVARCFTGWSVQRPEESSEGAITFLFRRFFHDRGEKTVLGTVIAAGGGESDGEQVLDMLASHPSTARFVSQKWVRRFVSDDPPPGLVEACAQTFQQTDGDVRALLRQIFTSDEFWNAPPKLKRPYEYIISLLRAMNYDVRNQGSLFRAVSAPLQAMGHLPFTWPAPDGFPDVASAWSDTLLMRWNSAIAAAGGSLPGAIADTDALVEVLVQNGVALELEPVLTFLPNYFYGRALTNDELNIVLDFARAAPGDDGEKIGAGIALLLAAPAFQYR